MTSLWLALLVGLDLWLGAVLCGVALRQRQGDRWGAVGGLLLAGLLLGNGYTLLAWWAKG